MHRILHRFTSDESQAQTRLDRHYKEFDVAAARKMLREGATLASIGEAQGLSGQNVAARLRKLGLGYLIRDPVRVGQCRSTGQRARIAREKGDQ